MKLNQVTKGSVIDSLSSVSIPGTIPHVDFPFLSYGRFIPGK